MSKNTGSLNRSGRKKGVPNKLTASAKEAFQFAFQKIGGGPALAAWAQENTTEFYKLFARLIPTETQVTGKDGERLNFVLHLPAKDARE